MLNTFITIADFCSAYRISRTTAYRQINAGRIPIIKVGRASRIRVSDAEAWATKLTQTKIAA